MRTCPKCGGSDWRREYINGRPRRWRCRICDARRMKQRRHALPHEPMYCAAMQRARKAGLPFEITLADVKEILAAWTCVYCDTPVGSFYGTRPTSATLDRLIPEKGYTRSNIVLACHRCNAAKAEHTPTTLRAWADRIEAVINRQHPTEESCSQ